MNSSKCIKRRFDNSLEGRAGAHIKGCKLQIAQNNQELCRSKASLSSYSIDDQLKILEMNKNNFDSIYSYILQNRRLPDIGYIPAKDREQACLFLAAYKVINNGTVDYKKLEKFQKRRLYESLDHN